MLYWFGIPILVISCLVFIWRQEIKEFVVELLEEFDA